MWTFLRRRGCPWNILTLAEIFHYRQHWSKILVWIISCLIFHRLLSWTFRTSIDNLLISIQQFVFILSDLLGYLMITYSSRKFFNLVVYICIFTKWTQVLSLCMFNEFSKIDKRAKRNNGYLETWYPCKSFLICTHGNTLTPGSLAILNLINCAEISYNGKGLNLMYYSWFAEHNSWLLG